MLGNILPLVEELLSGGGGFSNLVGKAGFAKSLNGAGELGDALRKVSDLKADHDKAQQAIEANRKKQFELGEKAREDERLYGFADPSTNPQLAALEQQNQQHSDAMRQHQRELSELNNRIDVTQNPRAAAFKRAATIGGVGTAVGAALPSLAANLPGMQGAGNLAGFLGGDANAAVMKDMLSTPVSMAGNVIAGASQGASIGSLAGPEGAAIGAAIGGMASAAGEITALPKKIVDWGEALVESKRNIAQFSGTLSMAFAEANRRGIMRNIESGQRTGGSIAELSRSLQDIYDEVQPIRDEVTIVLSEASRVMINGLKEGVLLAKENREYLKAMSQFMGGPIVTAAVELYNWLLNKAPVNPNQVTPLDNLFLKVKNGDPKKPFGPTRR